MKPIFRQGSSLSQLGQVVGSVVLLGTLYTSVAALVVVLVVVSVDSVPFPSSICPIMLRDWLMTPPISFGEVLCI